MGIYAYELSQHSRHVVVFEPNRDLWPHLQKFLGSGARLEAAALSDGTGVAELRYVKENTGVATIESENPLSMIADRDSIEKKSVPLRTLDSFGLSDISFIKIDVEGHEEAVVRGARELLVKERPVLLIESENRHNIGAPKRLQSYLSDLGFEAFVLSGAELIRADEVSEANLIYNERLPIRGGYTNNYIYLPVEKDELRYKLILAISNLPKSLIQYQRRTPARGAI